MNQEAINSDLKNKDTSESPLQTALLSAYKDFMCSSSQEMSEYWDKWDKNYFKYCGYRIKDNEDKKSEAKGGTSKIIVPMSYAQVQTAAAGVLAMLMQKERIFELMSFGPEDQTMCEGLERDIDYQVRYNRIYHFMYLYLIDVFVKGVGVGRCDWETVTHKYRVKETRTSMSILGSLMSAFGIKSAPTEEVVESVKELTQYEGNKITYISPYTFFPDPSVQLKDFQDGSFCATEQSKPKISVLAEEGKLYHGTAKIVDVDGSNFWDARPRYAGTFLRDKDKSNIPGLKTSTGKTVDLVEMYLKLIPSEYSEKYGIDIGNETDYQMFVMVVANDSKIIRFERYNELHGKFPFFCSQYCPDGDSYIGQSIPDMLSGLQDLVTWLINSHMANVRQTVKNRFVVNPQKVYVEDVESGSNIIRTKGIGTISDGITQLGTVDITAQHIPFVNTLNQIAQMTTGINENALGQYSGGRRSAAQTRGVTASVQARLGMAANLVWFGGLDTLGQIILSNTRQFRTEKVYNQILGKDAEKYPYDQVILANPENIAGGYDFAPLESLSESGKGQVFMLLKELMASPELVQAANLNIDKLLGYSFNLAGVKNYDYFKNAPQPPAGTPQIQVMPDDQIQQMAQQGQLEPMPQGGNPLAELLAGLQPAPQ